MPTQRSLFSRIFMMTLCLSMVVFTVSGCKKKDKGPILDDTMTDDTDVSGSGPEEDSGSGLNEGLDLTTLLFSPDKGLKPIYFDYDSSSLNARALSTLRDNAERIKEVPNVIIQVAGHCDERGTQEYNLALGERRAQSVREHLRQLGVSGDRLITISFGEEAPEAMGSNEAAWSKNRRCEFLQAQSM
ncbi:MAG: peptidoglycan-associated lipoprotein Pal [Candidatus Hydrogenedentes bacterium]|nr:peptidoglycan-associated lipoprotein Pal [Candidatus Hydrogenedentota bacterium]